MKKIFNTFLLILSPIIFIVLIAFFIYKFVPGKDITGAIPETYLQNVQVICNYPIRIPDQSMQPTFSSGQLVTFNKCIAEPDKLDTGTVIAYQEDKDIIIGRIQSIKHTNDKYYYQVALDSSPKNYNLVNPESVIAFIEE